MTIKDPSARSTAASVGARLHRRDLLKVSALAGCGGVAGRTLLAGVFPAQQAGQASISAGGGARRFPDGAPRCVPGSLRQEHRHRIRDSLRGRGQKVCVRTGGERQTACF